MARSFSKGSRRSKRPQGPKRPARGNKIAGRLWLLVLLVALCAMNYGASTVRPYLDPASANILTRTLAVSAVWSVMLLAAVCCHQVWARVLLILFLCVLTLAEILYLTSILGACPELKGDGLRVLFIHFAVNLGAALFLTISKDIRSVTETPNPLSRL